MNLKTIAAAILLLATPCVHAEVGVEPHVEEATSTAQAPTSQVTKPVIKKKKAIHHHQKRHHKKYHHTFKRPIPRDAFVAASQTSGVVTEGENYNRMVTHSPDMVKGEVQFPGASHVATGPYIGIPLQYSGSNLIVNSPSVNTDVALLAIRKLMSRAAPHAATGSYLLLSGDVQGQISYNKSGTGNNAANIDLSSVFLDAAILGPSEWVTGFIELGYDNSFSQEFSQYRVNNSRVYVNKAFLTLGNLNESPFYGSLGQYYVPFGAYSSPMVSDPLTKLLGRTKARALTLGVAQQTENAFNGSVYFFPGYSTAGNPNRINNVGVNAGYTFVGEGLKGSIGAGVMRNLADSVGLQITGFNGSSASEQLVHVVPAYNLRGSLTIGEHIDLIAEYIGASKKFAPSNMSFNGVGARPWALDLVAAYSFPILGDKPSSVAIGYGRTGQAVAMGLSQHRYSALFNTSLYRNTLQSFEYRHDQNYSAANTGSFNGAAAVPGIGKSDNSVTAQFDYFF